MRNTGRLATLRTDQHGVRDMDRHCLIDHTSLPSLALRTHMLFRYIQALDNHFADLWHGPRNGPLLPLILTCDNQDGITPLDIHLGKVERLLLFFFSCHLYPSIALPAQAK